MNKMYGIFIVLAGVVSAVYATPSTQIWNPSTDIQPFGTMHLGIDNYFSVTNNDTKALAFPTDTGLTYGLIKNIELGLDFMGPTTDPLMFNAKYGISESDKILPFSVSVGGFNFDGKSTGQNILYAVVAKNIGDIGRLTVGYYSGNEKALVDENGTAANTGLIATFDKQISDKIWTALDFASGKSSYGTLSFGASYNFSANTSVILGYVIYNNTALTGINNQVTTQVDINF